MEYVFFFEYFSVVLHVFFFYLLIFPSEIFPVVGFLILPEGIVVTPSTTRPTGEYTKPQHNTTATFTT